MLFIKADYIVTQDKKRQIIKDGAILVKDDKIFDVGEAKKLEKEYKKKIKIYLGGKGMVVIPGLINTHTHLAMTLLRGYADDMPLEKWWQEKVFPFESKLTAEDVYWGTLLGGVEMIKSGTTTFVDFYFFPLEIAKAVKKLGMRANIGIPLIDFPTPEFLTPDDALTFATNLIEGFITKNQTLFKTKQIQFSVAPHMLQTTSLKTYKKAKNLARKYKLLLQTHLAETKQEVNYSKQKYNQTPTELLIQNKILDKNSIVSHCCYLTTNDIKLLTKNKVNISHCPISNMKLASGAMPLKKLLKVGINISLGTDGACSNNNLDIFEEMKFAALLSKVINLDPTITDAQTVLDMATINGAKALGLGSKIGSLEKGKKADIVIIDFNKPHLIPCHNIVSNLVYAANGNDVNSVIINGVIVMNKRKILTVDENEILKKLNKTFSK